MTVVRLPLIICLLGWIGIQNITATHYEHWSTSSGDVSEFDTVISGTPSNYDMETKLPASTSSDDTVISGTPSNYDMETKLPASNIPILDITNIKPRRYIPGKSIYKKHSHCPANEIFRRCQPKCARKTCADFVIPIRCPRKDRVVCLTGCVCRKGYYRNANGVCVPSEECLICNRGHEVFKCGSACQETCDGESCPTQDPNYCKKDCYCRDNFVRNNRGFCIPREDCPRKVKCPGNKIYRNCGYAKTCENMADFEYSSEEYDCRPGCYCKEGFVENKGGDCVQPSGCYQCKKNEVYKNCRQQCPAQKCGNNAEVISCAAPTPESCKAGCDCIDNYVRDVNGICIPRDQCPENQCKTNEVYKNCRQQCPAQKCGINAEVVSCAAPTPENCKAGCDCIDNYVRDVNGICIPRDQCPETNEGCNGDPNAEIGCDTCKTSCSNYYVKPKRCNRRACRIDECKCKDGFVKNDKGLCIPYYDCPKTEGCKGDPNAEKGCDPYVKTCSNYNMGHRRYHKRICDNKSDGCKCIDGFVEDKRGLCIHPKNCSPQCPVNEVWSKCPDICKLETCNVLIHNYACHPIQAKSCIPRCICAEGFYRNDDRICVQAFKCFQSPPQSPKE